MATTASPLTPKQLELLNWVRNGCPDGVYEGTAHRTSARALAAKGLLKVKGHGSEWTVTLTDAGRDWKPGQAQPRRAASRAPAVTSPVPAKPVPPVVQPEPVSTEQAAELFQKVAEAGGRLRIPEGKDAAALYEELVEQSFWAPERPRGTRLEIVYTSTGLFVGYREIVFTDHFEDLVELQPVEVPEHVTKYSPVVRRYLDDKDWQYVTSEHLSRAGRILEAIVREAPNRGLTVLPPRPRGDGQRLRPTPECKQHVSLQVGDAIYTVQIREFSKAGGAPQSWPYGEGRRHAAWMYERHTAFIPTGRLELVMRGHYCGYEGESFRDVKTVKVEDRLPRLFQSLEIYRRQAEVAAEEKRRRDEERRQQWEAAMAKARVKYDQHARWEHFKRMSEESRKVAGHRRFLAEARAAATEYEGAEKEAIVAQLDLAERTLNEIDPLRQPQLLVPVVNEPKNDDLKPFLGRWSPKGPDSY